MVFRFYSASLVEALGFDHALMHSVLFDSCSWIKEMIYFDNCFASSFSQCSIFTFHNYNNSMLLNGYS